MSCNNAGDESAWNQKSLLCVYEIPKEVEYITAPPRMKLYIDYSSKIYAVYLEYIAKEDIHVYSIDEAFLDVTEYLKKIIYDDTVDPWDGYSWDIPAEYIPNIEYYKEHNDPILPAGFRTTADELVSESYCALYMMVEEWKFNYSQLIKDGWLKDCSEYEYISGATLTVTWKELGGGNYQLYIMW